MTILPIYVAPHPVLKTVAEPVAKVDAELRRLMDDMLETMYENNGVGLAAPQVGVSKRVITIDVEQKPKGAKALERKGKPLFLVNPEITWESEEERCYEEGCLSLPDQYAEVIRPSQVKVKFLDYDGKEQEMEASALLATVVQHEIDHLNGVLFVDYLSKLKRDMLMKKLKKLVKNNEEEFQGTHVIL